MLGFIIGIFVGAFPLSFDTHVAHLVKCVFFHSDAVTVVSFDGTTTAGIICHDRYKRYFKGRLSGIF